VAALVGAVDLFRRPPAPEPALDGSRAALVPVAFPVVARPALLVVALSAGADQGIPVTVAAMAAGVAVLTALVARWPAAGRGMRWAARLVAAALIAGGALLALDGLLAV
jgi:hypothetical protein